MANPGELDASFAGDGKEAIDFGGTDGARVVQVQPNGRIVVAGGGAAAVSFCVAGLRTNGATGRHAQVQPAGNRRAVAGLRQLRDGLFDAREDVRRPSR
jgi:hypothetical protein